MKEASGTAAKKRDGRLFDAVRFTPHNRRILGVDGGLCEMNASLIPVDEPRCRGALLPAVVFDVVRAPADLAFERAKGLAIDARGPAIVVFPLGDRVPRAGEAWCGLPAPARPHGPRVRSMPPYPALCLTPTHALVPQATAEAVDALLVAEGWRRRFAYDTWMLDAAGQLTAIFWTVVTPHADRRECSGRRRPG